MDNAFKGYNACLFAYGQTGSGKSYSIVGYGENKGIIPRACEDIFKRIAERESNNEGPVVYKHAVELTMIEIYNEKVQDLFVKPHKRPKNGLQVREHPERGIFVQDAATIPVASYKEITNAIDTANENRTIASTNMNATSSRAHTVLTIRFK